MRRTVLSLTVAIASALVALSTPAPTLAQTTDASDTSRAWFDKGRVAADQQDWPAALDDFSKAENKFDFADPAPSPTLAKITFNLGVVSAKIPGHEERAVAWFQYYLLTSPDAPDAADVQREITRLEGLHEAKNRLVLEHLDSFIDLTKRNIARLSASQGPEWTAKANATLAKAALYLAGAHYFAGDQAGALRVLEAGDPEAVRDGAPAVSGPYAVVLSLPMISDGLSVDAIVNSPKSGAFDDGAVSTLNFLLEAGDLRRAQTYLESFTPDDDTWMRSAEDFVCTAHDRADRAAFESAASAIEESLAARNDTAGREDLIRLYYYSIHEPDRLQSLAATVGAADRAAERLPDDDDIAALKPDADARCSGDEYILVKMWGDQKAEWHSRVAGLERPLWWSTGRDWFLQTQGYMAGYIDKDWDDTKIEAYLSKVADEMAAAPATIPDRTLELAMSEWRISQTYRMLRGPLHPSDASAPVRALIPTARLSLHLVDDATPPRSDDLRVTSLDGDTLSLEPAEPITGDMIASADAQIDPSGRPVIAFALTQDGKARFSAFTTQFVGRRFAIVINGRVVSAPTIQAPIFSGTVEITGAPDLESAKALAAAITPSRN